MYYLPVLSVRILTRVSPGRHQSTGGGDFLSAGSRGRLLPPSELSEEFSSPCTSPCTSKPAMGHRICPGLPFPSNHSQEEFPDFKNSCDWIASTQKTQDTLPISSFVTLTLCVKCPLPHHLTLTGSAGSQLDILEGARALFCLPHNSIC